MCMMSEEGAGAANMKEKEVVMETNVKRLPFCAAHSFQ